MRIEADSVLQHPRERVFATYRDEISAFVAFLPNVRGIEVVAGSSPVTKLASSEMLDA